MTGLLRLHASTGDFAGSELDMLFKVYHVVSETEGLMINPMLQRSKRTLFSLRCFASLQYGFGR